MGSVTRKPTYTPVVRFKTKPLKHQRHCLANYGAREFFALLAEMGTGKTWIAINNLAELWTKGEVDAALVFAPNGVQGMWVRIQIPEHMPASVRYTAASWSAQNTKKEMAKISDVCESDSQTLRILTMNWEALQHERSFRVALDFARSAKRLAIICDESDNIKNPKTIRWKSLMKLKPLSRYRRIMTGTPIDGSPYSAFGQYMFLDETILGTTSYFAFKAEYAEMLHANHPLLKKIIEKNMLRFVPQIEARDPHTGRPKYRNLDKLSKLIAPHSYRVLKKDCLDLPDKLPPELLFCKMTPQQEKIYKLAEKELRLEFDGEMTPFNKLAIATKLSQITSGYYLHPVSPDDPIRIPGPNPKMDLLIEHVRMANEAGIQVIVWARYTVQIQDIVKRMREEELPCVEYYGATKKKAREDAVDRFERGEVPNFVGNQQAGGSGITLVAAGKVFYFSNNWSLRDRLQSEDRAHRIGQTKRVGYTDFVAEDTVDEAMVVGVATKRDTADIIIDKNFQLFREGRL